MLNKEQLISEMKELKQEVDAKKAVLEKRRALLPKL